MFLPWMKSVLWSYKLVFFADLIGVALKFTMLLKYVF